MDTPVTTPMALPFLESVLASVIANVLTSVFSWVLKPGKDLMAADAALHANLTKHQPLESTLRQGTGRVARELPAHDPQATERLQLFLASPDVAAILRNLYAGLLTDQRADQTSLRALFVDAFHRQVGEGAGAWKSSAEELYDDIVRACDAALSVAMRDLNLPAHDAQSYRRFAALSDELRAIQSKLDLLPGPRPAPEAIENFEATYRKQAAGRHDRIPLHHADAERRVRIDEIYVAPHFRRTTPPESRAGAHLTLEQLRFGIHRTVLLGDPGAGKSTFATKLCYDLATHYGDGLVARRQLTPVFVSLRRYCELRDKYKASIAPYLEGDCNLQVTSPPGVIEHLLDHGRLLVVFDGLDELLDTSARKVIRDDVESFCHLYPDVPVLVTSREVGYEQAPLDPERFDVFRVGAFEPDQVREYSTKWFALQTELNPEEQREWAASFLRDSEIVPDLRSNPLMLALMCNLYRGDRYIPRNRPDVYEKCATLLFEKWDRSRNIRVPMPFEVHVLPAIRHLAYWIYSSEALQDGVTERDLVSAATDYLHERRFEDPQDAEQAARQFVEHCRGRLWVFSNVGRTSDDQELYRFTHRTFLEYFTAAWLVSDNHDPADLAEVLLPRIRAREWDVVAQLACQIQAKQTIVAADEFLSHILAAVSEATPEQRFSLISFAARALAFLVPKPATVRGVVTACLEYSFAWPAIRAAQPENLVFDASEPTNLLESLGAARPDNQPAVAKALMDILKANLLGTDDDRVDLAHEILERVPTDAVSGPLFTDPDIHGREKALASKSARAEFMCWWRGELTAQEVMETYGGAFFFRDIPHRMSGGSLLSFIRGFLHTLPSPDWADPYVQLAADVGDALARAAPPWRPYSATSPTLFTPRTFLDPARGGSPIFTDARSIFLLTATLATDIEMLEARLERSDLITQLAESSYRPFVDQIRPVLEARPDGPRPPSPDAIARAEQRMVEIGFTPEQRSVLMRWIRREVSLCKFEPADQPPPGSLDQPKPAKPPEGS